MKREPSGPNRVDMLRLFERLVKGHQSNSRIEISEACGEQEETVVIENGEDYAVIRLDLAQYVLDLAKKAKWPRGAHKKSEIATCYRDAFVIHWARRRKRELEDGGLSATDALWQAAEEARQHYRLMISATTIADRMQRRRSRR